MNYLLFPRVILFLTLLLISCNQPDQTGNKTIKESTEDTTSFFSDSIEVQTDHVYVYNCEGGLRFSTYVTGDTTHIFLPDTTARLQRVRSASGAKYEGTAIQYWSKELSAQLKLGGRSYKRCESQPQEKAWEAAKLRGVYFRALGQEPGWFLEVGPEEQITYIGQYGTDTLTAPVPVADTVNKKIIYETQSENSGPLTVEIRKELCRDGMSGFKHPASVTVSIDDEVFQGCGRFLQQ